MADIDELLKSSFDRLAEPADSTGVADLIRARVAAGDTGTSVETAVAPGWAGAGRPRWFWPLTGLVAGLAIVLAILVAVLVWPSAAEPEPTTEPTPVVTPSGTPTGSPTPAPAPTPTPTAVDEPEPPAPPPPPPAPTDTTAPTVQQVYANPPSNEIPCGPNAQTVIWALISDDTGVTRARVSWTGTTSGSGEMTAASGMWQYAFTLPSDGSWTFTVVGFDAAGNASAPASTNVNRVCIF